MKFFWGETKGLKADVERHRAKEKEYMDKIAELAGKEDPMSIAALRVYRRHLNLLQNSKADVVNKIGKKK
jgi:hypothetical protein